LRLCEEQADEQSSLALLPMDCFAPLAMTAILAAG
jgi:hypothetical protein